MIVRAARSGEYEAVLGLIRRAFPPGDEAVVVAAATIRDDPAFQPDHLRVAEHDGQIVGAINLIDRQVRFGTATARCAIVAPLATAPEHQGTGVGSVLMRDALVWAGERGFVMSMLWGHPWLYPRYGYAPAINSYAVRLPASAAPVGDGAYTLRAATAADTTALHRVYTAETARATLAEARAAEPWEWRPHGQHTAIEVAVDPARAVRGYMRVTPGDDRLQVGEMYAMDAGAAQALFDRVIHLAREHEANQIEATVTPDNRWSRLALSRGAQVCVGSGGGAGMVRVIDLPALLRALEAELRRRVARSELVAARAAVRIESPVGRATIEIDHGDVWISDRKTSNTALLPFHALNPLISGYQSIDELRASPGVFLRGDETQRALDVLFPAGYPHWSFAAYFS